MWSLTPLLCTPNNCIKVVTATISGIYYFSEMTFPPVIKECVKSVSSAAHLMPPLCLGNNLIHTGTRTLSLATPHSRGLRPYKATYGSLQATSSLSVYLRLVPLPENPHMRPLPDKLLSVLQSQFHKCHSPRTPARIPRGSPVSLLHAPEGPDSV